jgi:hypothetical protein
MVRLNSKAGAIMHGARELWRVGDIVCVMISCCTGAELQLRRPNDILLRELYPTKPDLYQRARDLEDEYEALVNA